MDMQRLLLNGQAHETHGLALIIFGQPTGTGRDEGCVRIPIKPLGPCQPRQLRKLPKSLGRRVFNLDQSTDIRRQGGADVHADDPLMGWRAKVMVARSLHFNRYNVTL
ncbi:hypothetical protein [Pseudomonas sp. 51_B]|uniref:hypothetical protein n=1 Tax=Pseudomonas sp. 51_B TaxID=2813573 RepID=UPI00325FBB24